ncbi:hypothetical protein DFH28DRAFT_967663 [Melampsora americana]|nr:hypothetical protein DFH28DRAFT_967663 [Melampsora americana]
MQRGSENYFPSFLDLEPIGPSGLDFIDIDLDSLEDSDVSFENSDVPDGLYTIDEMVTEEEAADDLDQDVPQESEKVDQKDEDQSNFDWIDNSLDQILEIRSNLLEQRNFNRIKRRELDLIGQDLEEIKSHRVSKKTIISNPERLLSTTSTETCPPRHSENNAVRQEPIELQYITAQSGSMKIPRKSVPMLSPRSLIFAPHLPTTLNVAFQNVRPDVTGPIEDRVGKVTPDLTLDSSSRKTSCSLETSRTLETPSSTKHFSQSQNSGGFYKDFDQSTIEIKQPQIELMKKSIRKSLSTPSFHKNKTNENSKMIELDWDQLEDILEGLDKIENIPSLDWNYTSKIKLIKVKILERKRSQLRRGNLNLKPKFRNL